MTSTSQPLDLVTDTEIAYINHVYTVDEPIFERRESFISSDNFCAAFMGSMDRNKTTAIKNVGGKAFLLLEHSTTAVDLSHVIAIQTSINPKSGLHSELTEAYWWLRKGITFGVYFGMRVGTVEQGNRKEPLWLRVPIPPDFNNLEQIPIIHGFFCTPLLCVNVHHVKQAIIMRTKIKKD